MILLGVPGLLYFVLFYYVPLLGNVVAFKDYQPYIGIFESAWNGIENFRGMIADPLFWYAARNTLVISGLQLILFFPAPIILALLLSSITTQRVRRAIQNIIYIPHFISWVIIAIFFQDLLGGTGPLAQLQLTLQDHGWLQGQEPWSIIGNPDLFPLLITGQAIWQGAGWGTIIYLAALAQIDEGLYEASAVDGAGRWRRMWHVTLPGIMGVTILLLILRLGAVLTVGFEPVLLQQNAVGPNAGTVIDTYIYLNGIGAGQWGVAAAAGLIKGVIGTLLVLGANKMAHRFGQPGLFR